LTIPGLRQALGSIPESRVQLLVEIVNFEKYSMLGAVN
jgi:hypothetical protein